jgi:23S rRNA (pseudouridine1915-N3)-methyltransferase
MLTIDLLTVGKLKKGPFYDLQEDYQKRIRWQLNLFQIESRISDPKAMNIEENRKILGSIVPSAYVIVLDEHGNGLRSVEFAKMIEKTINNGQSHMQFIIGGAEGVNNTVKQKASLLLSLGQPTWPHMMARVMLLEQIYRAQQIMAGHPYHRE